MNDPGLDDAIADEAVALDHTSSNKKDQTDQDATTRDAKYPQVARWWFASTTYPLTAVCQLLPCVSSTLSLALIRMLTISTGHIRPNGQRFQHMLPIPTMANGPHKHRRSKRPRSKMVRKPKDSHLLQMPHINLEHK
jgi:hypothetical protein